MKGLSIKIKATNMELTDAIKQFVYEKLDGLDKFYPQLQLLEVELKADDKHRKGYFYAEINATVPGKLLRATEKNEDLYAAIDLSKDAIERQLRKRAGKMDAKRRNVKKSRRAVKSIMFWRRFDRFSTTPDEPGEL